VILRSCICDKFRRAKYQPYDALRQRFWRQYLKQYDLDETGTYSRIEMQSMLDSLGSTLTKTTIDDFFTRYQKNPEMDELSLDESIMALEHAMTRPASEKKLVNGNGASVATGAITPNLNFSDFPSVDSGSQPLELAGPDADTEKSAQLAAQGEPLPETFRESNQLVLPGQGTPRRGSSEDDVYPGHMPSQPNNGQSSATSDISDLDGSTSPSPGPAVERVINIRTCPLCHQPRLSNKAEMDMVTHLAVCASSDWNRVNRLVVGNYVTASQAQRKWYTNVVTKVSSGAYQLGAVSVAFSTNIAKLTYRSQNSANIIVQNRLTGQLEEEKMQAFVRLGIRLLYKVCIMVHHRGHCSKSAYRGHPVAWKVARVRGSLCTFETFNLILRSSFSSPTTQVHVHKARDQIRFARVGS